MMAAVAGPQAGSAGPELEVSWIRRVADGDREAFERLYHAYHGPLFRYLRRMVGSCEAAEELTDDVMVAVWRGAGGFRAQSRPSTWIFGIAHHKALDALRGRRRPTLPIDSVTELPDPAEGPEAALGREAAGRRLRGALAELTSEQREVVHLAFYQGLSYPEIAAIVRCPVNTVKTRMFQARRRLLAALGGRAAGRETA